MGAIRSRTHISFDALLPKRGGNGDSQFRRRESRPYRLLRGRECLVVAGQEPPLASHVVTPRRGYLHHGIYIGGGTVVHYAGLANGLRRGPVEEISLARFAGRHPLWVRSDARPKFDCREVLRRARSRIGEDCYRLLTNNCEHFCEWCLRGEHRSYQVEAWLAGRRRVLHATIHFIARLLCPPRRVRRDPAPPLSTNSC
jgi:hypothetical protein